MMIDYSHPCMLALRQFGQKLGVLRPMVRAYRRVLGKAYEENFDIRMLDLVRTGQIVWDIGANIGVFTVKFSDAVGPSGRVLAFEPAPNTFNTLKRQIVGRKNVKGVNAALADFSGKATFALSDDANDPTNSLLKSAPDQGSYSGSVAVDVFRAQDYVKNHPDDFPNFIKVDVEGFEDDVIKGAGDMLRDSRLQVVCVEVHFLELAKRGRTSGATYIADALRSAGFKVAWTDPSHIVATRIRHQTS